MTGRRIVDSGTFHLSDGTNEGWRLERNPRARRISVHMDVARGIRVVAPPRMPCDPLAVLEHDREWVERAHARMADERAGYLSRAAAPLPDVLVFPTAGEEWTVVRHPSKSDGVRMRAVEGRVLEPSDGRVSGPFDGRVSEPSAGRVSESSDGRVLGAGGTLVISGATDQIPLMRDAYRRFACQRAKIALPELLDATSTEFDLHYASCRVSNARTRWGSCSAKGVIMLSASLLFLPPELSYHVMCHELAHIAHLDHSQAFHRTLDSLDPDSRAHARALRDAGGLVPDWMR